MVSVRTSLGLGALLALLVLSPGAAAEWGDLTATFVYDGPSPEPVPAKITSDREFCTAFDVLDESLLVDPQNHGVANVILFLSVGPRDTKPPIHEQYAATENGEVFLDNKHCRYDPHVVLLRTSQTLVVGNSDAVAHNTNLAPFRNAKFNELIPSAEQKRIQLPAEEALPVRVGCNIHPWMSAWLLVKDHPYMAVSDENGKLVLENLPAGEWSFQMWHEKAGYLREVVTEGGQTDRRGRFTMTIQPGENDLGRIKLPPALFQ